MSILRRIEKLEDRIGQTALRDGRKRLASFLQQIAARAGGAPLSPDASPAEVAAIAMDRPADPTVQRRAAELARRDGPVGRLFRAMLDTSPDHEEQQK